jgi:hypothetical protein
MEWIQTLSKSLVAPIGKIMTSKIKMPTPPNTKQGVKALVSLLLKFQELLSYP